MPTAFLIIINFNGVSPTERMIAKWMGDTCDLSIALFVGDDWWADIAATDFSRAGWIGNDMARRDDTRAWLINGRWFHHWLIMLLRLTNRLLIVNWLLLRHNLVPITVCTLNHLCLAVRDLSWDEWSRAWILALALSGQQLSLSCSLNCFELSQSPFPNMLDHA